MKLFFAMLPVVSFLGALLIAVRLLSPRSTGESSPFPFGSLVLLGVSIFTIAMVTVAALVPGGTGPVQYASGNGWATFFFSQRASTILAMALFPILAGIAGLIRYHRHQKINNLMTAIGIASWIIAWIVLFANLWFWPRA